MDTQSWPWELASRCIKTERQKKRALKDDHQKQLIKLYNLWLELKRQRQNLPWVALEEPYQRGWKRTFVLRPDVARTAKADFYAELLVKINTVMHSPEKEFKKKKRRQGKRVYVERPQFLRSFYSYEWFGSGCGLTQKERALFLHHDDIHNKRIRRRYVFAEPWRFTLKVVPHMITHVKMIDEILQQRIAELDNYIEYRQLWPAMYKAKRGDSGEWKDYSEKAKYRNPLKNLPLHRIVANAEDDVCLEDS